MDLKFDYTQNILLSKVKIQFNYEFTFFLIELLNEIIALIF